MAKRSGSFKFKNTDQIGAAGAEEDEFLSNCFVDTGYVGIIENLKDHRQIVLGRTGSGKSALLLMFAASKQDHVITISPEALALTYVSNSTILGFFANLGVNLDPFFKLLWRHVLTIEILSNYFSKHEPGSKSSLGEMIRNMFSSNSRKDQEIQEALDYLEKWGKEFWKETEYRVKEITQTVENELDTEIEAALGGKYANVKGKLASSDFLTEEKKSQLLDRGQDIIKRAQVKDLQKILDLLSSVLEDRQKAYYLLIDALDENWVEESLRYKLIMALIQNARDFIKVKNAKLIIALRRDLIERVFRITRESGFQEEKYQSFYLPLTWSKAQILEVLDRRINQLVKRAYTKGPVGHRDLFPAKYQKENIGDFIFKIAPRPRDVIAFFNACIRSAENKPNIGTQALRAAVGEYSRTRLRALGDEWSGDYPTLLEFAKILQRRKESFKIETIEDSKLGDLCLTVAAENPKGRGILQQFAMQVADCVIDIPAFKIALIQIFYRVGLVGLKLQPHETVSMVDETGRAVSSGEITQNTSVVVFPPYRRALGIIEEA